MKAPAGLAGLAALALVCPPAAAQQSMIANIAAPAEPGAFPLYPADNVGSTADEVWTRIGPMTALRNVTRPTLTAYLPSKDKATGTAVIVAAGGGMIMLAMGEGEKAARELAERGIAAFVLKYRLVSTPREVKDLMGYFGQLREKSKAGEVILPNDAGDADAQAAVAMIRANAAIWKVDPAKVGLIGFSSGAQVSRKAALSPKPEGRPAFVGLIYGAMDAVEVPPTAPPMFAAIAMDDTTVSPVGFPVVESWRKVGRPVELHAYQSGGHGFATAGPDGTSRFHIDQFVAWLALNKFVSHPKK